MGELHVFCPLCDCDTGVRLDALVRGADWAQMGTHDGIDEAFAELNAEALERNPA